MTSKEKGVREGILVGIENRDKTTRVAKCPGLGFRGPSTVGLGTVPSAKDALWKA